MEGREESDLKEEQEKKETGPAEERKEEEEKDSEVKEEKSGAAQRTERKDGNWVKGFLTPFVTDREKVAEEKETPRAAETADAKAKPELLDLKKGASLARVMASTHSRPQSGETPSSTSASSSWPLGFTRTPSSLHPPKSS